MHTSVKNQFPSGKVQNREWKLHSFLEPTRGCEYTPRCECTSVRSCHTRSSMKNRNSVGKRGTLWWTPSPMDFPLGQVQIQAAVPLLYWRYEFVIQSVPPPHPSNPSSTWPRPCKSRPCWKQILGQSMLSRSHSLSLTDFVQNKMRTKYRWRYAFLWKYHLLWNVFFPLVKQGLLICICPVIYRTWFVYNDKRRPRNFTF